VNPASLPQAACGQYVFSTAHLWLGRSRWFLAAGRVGGTLRGKGLPWERLWHCAARSEVRSRVHVATQDSNGAPSRDERSYLKPGAIGETSSLRDTSDTAEKSERDLYSPPLQTDTGDTVLMVNGGRWESLQAIDPKLIMCLKAA